MGFFLSLPVYLADKKEMRSAASGQMNTSRHKDNLTNVIAYERQFLPSSNVLFNRRPL